MADNEDNEDDLAVKLGDGEAVRGVPLARVASRLTWPIEASEIRRKEGQVKIRTQYGARPVTDVLAEVDVTYFESRQEFIDEARDAIGVGPVLTE